MRSTVAELNEEKGKGWARTSRKTTISALLRQRRRWNWREERFSRNSSEGVLERGTSVWFLRRRM